MIITRTPLRISFFGGGTDIPSYYQQDFGSVIGIGINKYVYVLVNERFENNIRASYSKTEIVKEAKKVKHDLIRESLLKLGIKNKIEIVTVADVPGSGTGLGSSGSTLVGLLNSLSCYINDPLEKHELAEISCDIEINKLRQPIGKQDQYFATYGGLTYFRFNKDGSVKKEKIISSRNTLSDLENNLMCFYTGISRSSSDILTQQKKNAYQNNDILIEMRNQVEEGKKILKNGDLTKFGLMLNEGWKLKKKLAKNISNNKIDLYYKKAIKAGALGGKISGAGGGGFLTFYCEKKHQDSVKKSLSTLTSLKIKIDKFGTLVLRDS